jgi:hypothetical protein
MYDWNEMYDSIDSFEMYWDKLSGATIIFDILPLWASYITFWNFLKLTSVFKGFRMHALSWSDLLQNQWSQDQENVKVLQYHYKTSTFWNLIQVLLMLPDIYLWQTVMTVIYYM